MKLTEQCKIDFEKWYRLEYRKNVKDTLVYPLSAFKGFHSSMQYGVLVDFFDGFGIDVGTKKFQELEAIRTGADTWEMFLRLFHTTEAGRRVIKKATKEAREKAILKANEIYNTNR